MDLSIVSYIAIMLYVVLSVCVTVLLVTRDELEPFQKGAQIFLVWLIPFLAAIGVWILIREQKSPKPYKTPFGGGPQDSGVASGSD